MHYIEGGWPGSNPKDVEFFERARQELPEEAWAKIVAFGRFVSSVPHALFYGQVARCLSLSLSLSLLCAASSAVTRRSPYKGAFRGIDCTIKSSRHGRVSITPML